MTVNNNNAVDRELGWNDAVTYEEMEFITLAPGDYNFKVKGFERSRFEGSAKMPACPVAEVTIVVTDPATGSEVEVINRLMLHTKTQWRIAQFFTSIGLGSQPGQPFVPQWNAIAGRTGVAKIKNRTYNDNVYNEVDKFLEPASTTPNATAQKFTFK